MTWEYKQNLHDQVKILSQRNLQNLMSETLRYLLEQHQGTLPEPQPGMDRGRRTGIYPGTQGSAFLPALLHHPSPRPEWFMVQVALPAEGHRRGHHWRKPGRIAGTLHGYGAHRKSWSQL